MRTPFREPAVGARDGRLLAAMKAFALEVHDELDRTAALALRAQAEGDLRFAAAAAGIVVLAEHLQAASYRHAMRMLGVLADVGPDAAADGIDGLLAWAGAAIAHDYGLLPSWPEANVAMLMERAQHAPSDVALALACALGEVCERNGEDGEFAALQARVAAVEVDPAVPAFWRGYWAIVSAWHLCAFARTDEARLRFDAAHRLAAENGLAGLAAQVALQRARLIDSRCDPGRALALADAAVASGDSARTPLWFADQADVRCRVALRALDFHAAVGHARSAVGYLQAGDVWPGYQVTYRVNETYALIGIGAVDEALVQMRALTEVPLPAYLAARIRCLAELTVHIAADQRSGPEGLSVRDLASAIGHLRELEWPNVLALLPQHMGRIFAQALDHGVEVDWVCAAIRTRRLPAPPGAPESWPWAVKVHTLGGFDVSTASGMLPARARESRKASSKPLELLRLLATLGQDAVTVDWVASALWPGDGRDGRQKAFEVTTARLRRLLACDAAVIVFDRRVRLNTECVWVDAIALERALADGAHAPPGSPRDRRAIERALNLYQGPCLADIAQPWAMTAAERLRARLAAALLRTMRDGSVAPSLSREWTLRAVAADRGLAPLLIPSTPAAGGAST